MDCSLLHTLYVPGVIAFVKDKNVDQDGNPGKPSVYITASRNLLQTVTRLIPEYKNWEIVILETNIDIELLKVRQKHYIDIYKCKGYSIVNKRPPVNYKIKVLINKHFKVEVWLYPAHSTRTLLGTFDYMEDAQLFASEQYKKYEIN